MNTWRRNKASHVWGHDVHGSHMCRGKSRPAHASSDTTHWPPAPRSPEYRTLSSFLHWFQIHHSSFRRILTRVLLGTLDWGVEYQIPLMTWWILSRVFSIMWQLMISRTFSYVKCEQTFKQLRCARQFFCSRTASSVLGICSASACCPCLFSRTHVERGLSEYVTLSCVYSSSVLCSKNTP